MYPAEFGGKASALINVVTQVRHATHFMAARSGSFANESLDAPQFLRRPIEAGAAAAPEPVRRQPRRPAQAQPDVLLLQLRRTPLAASQTQVVFSAYRRVARTETSPDQRPVCDPLTTDNGVARHFPTTRFPRTVSARWRATLLAKVPEPHRAPVSRRICSASRNSDHDLDQLQHPRRSSRRPQRARSWAASPRSDAEDDQPFGTTSLNESTGTRVSDGR